MTIDCSTQKETEEQMKLLLGKIVPDFEIKIKSELVFEINRLT